MFGFTRKSTLGKDAIKSVDASQQMRSTNAGSSAIFGENVSMRDSAVVMRASAPRDPQAGFISKNEMKDLLDGEYNPEMLEKQLKHCCSEHKKCSDDLARLAEIVDELARMKPKKFVDRVSGME